MAVFKPQIYTFNMVTDEAITLTYNPALKDKYRRRYKKPLKMQKRKSLRVR